MKFVKYLSIILLLLFSTTAFSQRFVRDDAGQIWFIDSTTGDTVKVDVTGAVFKIVNTGATFEMSSMTTTQRNALTASAGMIINNTTDGQIQGYDGTSWNNLGAGAGSGEDNTASNLGGGLANFDSKSAVDLRFNSFLATDFNLAANQISLDRGLAATWTAVHSFADNNFQINNPANSFQYIFGTAAIAADRTLELPLLTGNDTFTFNSFVNVWGDGIKQTFNPDATNAGLNVGSLAGQPSSPADGDIIYNTSANQIQARVNSAWVDLGASGGTVNTADIADVSVTQTEFAELETIGATTISANQWAMLGGVAETLGSAELDLLDGLTNPIATDATAVTNLDGTNLSISVGALNVDDAFLVNDAADEMLLADATTNVVTDILDLSHTGGTVAAGFGTGIRFDIEDAGGIEEQASIDVSLDVVTDGAEEASIIFRHNVAGTMQESMRIDGTSGSVGIGTSTPTHTLDIHGEVEIEHTATEAGDHALDMNVDAAGFGDVKGLEIEYDTGAIAAGQDEAVILVEINELDATGGEVFGLEVLSTEGSAIITALKAGAVVAPILQDSGVFANPSLATNNTNSTDVADMRDNSTGTNTTIFASDNDFIIIGADAAFTEIAFVVETGFGNPGIQPVFAYSISGTNQFTNFNPVDGTNGFKDAGATIVAWDAADLTGHVADDVTGKFDIRITRTANPSGSVSLFYARSAATRTFFWDKDGNICVLSLILEGATDDANEHTISLIDPTADRLFNFPDDQLVAGDVLVASDASDLEYLNLATTEILIGDGSGIPTAAALSGGATMDNAGVVTIVTNANLTGHVTSTGNAALLGSFTVGQLSTALSDATISGNNTGDEPAADLTTPGIIEIATVTETNTGTDATRAVSPDGLDGWTGSAQVTTLGTIATGVWNGTAVTYANLNFSNNIVAGDIATDAVANVELADMAQNTIKMRVASGTGDPEDIDISAGLSLVTGVSGDFVIIEDATDGDLKRVDVSDFLGGGVTWDAIGDAAGAAGINMAEQAQTLDWNTAATAAAFDGLDITLTNDATSDAARQVALKITRPASSGTATVEALVEINNEDTDGAVTAAIEVVSAAGVITNALLLSDSDIVNWADIGANDLVTAAGTITSVELDRLTGLTSGIIDDDQIDTFDELNTIVADRDLNAVLVADNESSAETNAVVFLPGGDLDGGILLLESDGTFNYNPSTGTVTATVFAGTVTEINDLEADDPPNVATNEVYAGTGAGAGAWTLTPTLAGTNFTGTGASFTAGVSTLATVTDNESTAEENPIVFVAGADPDGGTLGLETDGNATYNPSTGTITATEFIGGGVGITGVTASHAGTITWTGTSILETGVAFQFGDASDATLTHTYANTGTNVDIAYSTAAMAITGVLTATNLSGTNTGDEVAADLTTAGVIEIATGAETNTGTDATRAVSPDGLDDWTGSAQIITLGTVATGTWEGTTVAVNQGGTGATALDDILGTTDEITVTNGANTIIGGDATLTLPDVFEEVMIPAGYFNPAAGDLTGATALADDADNTNDFTLDQLEFSASAENYVSALIKMPPDWDGSTDPTFRVFYYTETGSANDVDWTINTGYIRPGTDTWVAALGTADSILHSPTTTDIIYDSGLIDPTAGGTAAVGAFIKIRLWRDGDDANDDHAATARLLYLVMGYLKTTYGDETAF